MTKAEEAALKAYPVNMTPLNYQDLIEQFGGKTEIDVNTYPRRQFQEGYEQAEKDLALTWEDVRRIVIISEDVFEEGNNLSEQEFYEEVLTRFKKYKEAKK